LSGPHGRCLAYTACCEAAAHRPPLEGLLTWTRSSSTRFACRSFPSCGEQRNSGAASGLRQDAPSCLPVFLSHHQPRRWSRAQPDCLTFDVDYKHHTTPYTLHCTLLLGPAFASRTGPLTAPWGGRRTAQHYGSRNCALSSEYCPGPPHTAHRAPYLCTRVPLLSYSLLGRINYMLPGSRSAVQRAGLQIRSVAAGPRLSPFTLSPTANWLFLLRANPSAVALLL